MKRILSERTSEKYESDITKIRAFWYGKTGRLLEEHLREVMPGIHTIGTMEHAAMQGCVMRGWRDILREIDRVANLNNPAYQQEKDLQIQESLPDYRPQRPEEPWEKRMRERQEQKQKQEKK